ncbi:hypothetical protein CBR_g37727 [Chara braunii]|uniref:CCHC-type domain-containing protein n=1 Tax=Chara braunii TaxID=69332 RepID=A0A388JZY9_CHABU|nr:hypothetical protein CBR_g37727 [Chara braunii]|eukprot:GBG63369.1 hypothetical protein CBR_g37727 [Chara braunii]
MAPIAEHMRQSILTRWVPRLFGPGEVPYAVGASSSLTKPRTRAQIEARRSELGELLSQLLVDMEFAVPAAREHIRGKFDLDAISDRLAKAITGVEMIAAATEIQKVIRHLVKGKTPVVENDEEKEDKERKADVKLEKLLLGGMKNGDTTKKETVKETEKQPEEKKPEEKKPEGNGNGDENENGNGNGNGGPSGPTPSPKDNAKPADPTKPKKKEKVKMKLPFTFSNKKEESLPLWIAEIQTYVGTAPVEEESQVAFTTSCMGGEVKQWVLAEANAAGFDDIGDWAKTMTLKQFLAKVKDRFLDKTTADKAFDQLTMIGQKSWSSVESLSREVDRLLQVLGLNLQDSQVLYIYSRALPESIRGHLVAEAKSGKYSYRQFRDLALQREQITSQVKGSYAAAVKNGGGSSRGGYDKRVIWRQKRQDHTLVVFDDDTMEKWPLENEGVGDSSSDPGKGEITAATVNKGGPSSNTRPKGRPRSFPYHPGIAVGRPWLKMGLTREVWQDRMDNAQCLKCGTAGHVIAFCPLIRNSKGSSQ